VVKEHSRWGGLIRSVRERSLSAVLELGGALMRRRILSAYCDRWGAAQQAAVPIVGVLDCMQPKLVDASTPG